MKTVLTVAEISERLGRAALTLKNAGDVSASDHIKFALSLLLRMTHADEESIEPPSEED